MSSTVSWDDVRGGGAAAQRRRRSRAVKKKKGVRTEKKKSESLVEIVAWQVKSACRPRCNEQTVAIVQQF